MSNSLIVSLAFLKVNSDSNGKDYLDNFLPLVAECLRESKDSVVSINNLQNDLKERFGICIPLQVIKSLLSRARKKDYVLLKDHTYYRNEGILCNLSFQNSQTKIQRIYSALIQDFQKFSKEKYEKDLSEQEAEQLILSFISYNQTKIFQGNQDFKILPDYPELNIGNKVIIADYITTVHECNPQVFDYIETIVKGYMIANALYLPDSNISSKKFQKTKIFFDTSFIIFALGFSGDEIRVPCIELLDLLYVNGAQLCCFRHTVDEIKGILNACSNRLGQIDDSAFGRSIQFFSSHGYTASDIKLLISTLERAIESLRIHIVNKPDYYIHQYVINEEELGATLRDKVKYPREGALTRDVDSISSIYRLRKGQSYFCIEDSKAIFVTTNNTLARTINEFYYQDHDNSTVSPCITDYSLTNIVWLKTPTKAPNLPMKRVIADCYAAIQPDDALMARWIREINKLNDRGALIPEDYYFMRFSDEASKALMEFSLGDLDAVSEGTIPEILQRAKRKITEETEQRLKEVNQNLSDEIARRKASEEEIQSTQNKNDKKEMDRMSNLRIRANRLAKIATRILRVLSFLILILGLIISSPWELIISLDFSRIMQFVPNLAIALLFTIMLILNLVNQFWGVSLNALINSIEVKISNKAFAYLKSLTE